MFYKFDSYHYLRAYLGLTVDNLLTDRYAYLKLVHK